MQDLGFAILERCTVGHRDLIEPVSADWMSDGLEILDPSMWALLFIYTGYSNRNSQSERTNSQALKGC